MIRARTTNISRWQKAKHGIHESDVPRPLGQATAVSAHNKILQSHSNAKALQHTPNSPMTNRLANGKHIPCYSVPGGISRALQHTQRRIRWAANVCHCVDVDMIKTYPPPMPSWQRRAHPTPPGRAAWVRSPPTPTHKTCLLRLLSTVGDLKWNLVPFFSKTRACTKKTGRFNECHNNGQVEFPWKNWIIES